MRILRMGGFVDSARGHTGGYKLSRAASEIVWATSWPFWGDRCSGRASVKTMPGPDALRPFRGVLDPVSVEHRADGLDRVLGQVNLSDLLRGEEAVNAAMLVKAEALMAVSD